MENLEMENVIDYVHQSLSESIESMCDAMTVEEEKELLEYVKENCPTLDMVQHIEIWIKMNARFREEEEVVRQLNVQEVEIWMRTNARLREEEDVA